MKVFAIGNPAAGGGRAFRAREELASVAAALGARDLRWSDGPGDVETQVRRAVEEGAGEIVLAGGDGSINEAVNGVFRARSAHANTGAAPVTISLYPVGTGSDFARSFPDDSSDPVACDVGRVRAPGSTERYFLNVASFGVSADIAARVSAAPKWLGGRASFWLGSLEGLARYSAPTVRLSLVTEAGSEEMELPVTMVAIANAQYFGGGMHIAPHAQLDDALLDVILVRRVGLGTFLRESRRLYAGTHIDLPFIDEARVSRLVASPAETTRRNVRVDTDGETAGILPATFDILPRALRVRKIPRSFARPRT